MIRYNVQILARLHALSSYKVHLFKILFEKVLNFTLVSIYFVNIHNYKTNLLSLILSMDLISSSFLLFEFF